MTDSRRRRLPRWIALTVPDPGDVNLTSGSRLSTKRGWPSDTRSPRGHQQAGFQANEITSENSHA